MKFEVGKKYHTNSFPRDIYTCLAFSCKGKAVLESNEGMVFPVQDPGMWVEYREPKTGSLWVNIYENTRTFVHNTKNDADQHQMMSEKRIACVELKWKEGDGLEEECSDNCTAAGGQPCAKKGCKA